MKSVDSHRPALMRLLSDIFKHPILSSQLGFKGGTCLYFLHNLPRFSIDLDYTFTLRLAQERYGALAE